MYKVCLLLMLAGVWGGQAIASSRAHAPLLPLPLTQTVRSAHFAEHDPVWLLAKRDHDERQGQRPSHAGFQPERGRREGKMSPQEREELRRQVREANRQLDEQRRGRRPH